MKTIKVVEEIRKPICDLCVLPFSDDLRPGCLEKTTHILINFGYCSNRDTEHGHYILCQNCSEKLLPLLTQLGLKFPEEHVDYDLVYKIPE